MLAFGQTAPALRDGTGPRAGPESFPAEIHGRNLPLHGL